jgi:hypothetical protein
LLRRIKNGPVELHSQNYDLGSTEWAKTVVRRVGVYAGACDINVKATSGRRTIATAKIVEDAQGALTLLFRLKLAAFESSLEAPESLPSKLTAAIP